MSYQTPSLEELKTLALSLKEYSGDNKDRKNIITLINRIVEDPNFQNSENAQHILMGAYIFCMGQIDKSYDYYRVLRSPNNSWVYKTIDQGIHASGENPITNDFNVIYLSAFYNYLKSSAPKDLVQETTWMQLSALLPRVKGVIKRVLDGFEKEIAIIVSNSPFPVQFAERIKNMQAQYAATAQSGWFFSTGKAHAPLAQFIDLINDYCENFIPLVEEAKLDPALKLSESYMLRMAAVTFVMCVLEKECRLKPNSKLWGICCNAMVTPNGTADIDVDDKVLWLQLLAKHLDKMPEVRAEFVNAQEKANYKNIRAELKRIKDLCTQYALEYQVQKNAPSTIETGAVLAASVAAQNGITSVARNVIGGDVIPGPGAVVIDTAAGALGTAVGGPAGTAIAVALARFVRSYIIPFALAGIVAGTLDATGTYVGSTAWKAFTMPARGLLKLVEWCRSVEIDKNALTTNELLMKALLSLPDDLFSADKKDKIEGITGFKRLAM